MSEATVPPAGPSGRSGPDIMDTVGKRIEAGLARLTEGLSASRVFGKPEHVGDRVIITAAALQTAGGFGFGGGGGSDEEGMAGSGGGGGGGGSSEGRPVAVIEIADGGVSVRPVFDLTRIWVTVITGLFAIWRAGRRR
ncbi:MAG: hypothetical protein ACE5KX_00375 [Acidimicrobiia bacterium]